MCAGIARWSVLGGSDKNQANVQAEFLKGRWCKSAVGRIEESGGMTVKIGRPSNQVFSSVYLKFFGARDLSSCASVTEKSGNICDFLATISCLGN